MRKSRKTILFVTTSRSDFALIEPLLSLMSKDKQLRPFLFVTGDHMSPQAGETYQQIKARGVPIDAKYRLRSADPSAQVGEVVSAVAALLRKHKVSYAFICADRKEMFAAAIACAMARVPLFHGHGGDVTYGMIDDAMRHAITKLSSVHFAVSPLSARRILQMGEERWRVCVTGSPDADAARASLPEEETLCKMALHKKKYALLLLNPETLLTSGENAALARATLRALGSYRERVLVISPNNDTSAGSIRAAYKGLDSGKFTLVSGVPREQYLALLKNAAFLIGNSSSGITEAAAFKTPAINVGHRQDGRERNRNTIDVSAGEKAIRAAIRKAQSPAFLRSIKNMRNVYGRGGASERIYRALKRIVHTRDTRSLLYKTFTLI